MFTSQFKATFATLALVFVIGATVVNQLSLQKQINDLKKPTPAHLVVMPSATPSATLVPTRALKPFTASPSANGTH